MVGKWSSVVRARVAWGSASRERWIIEVAGCRSKRCGIGGRRISMLMAPAGLTAGPSAGDEETGWAYAELSSSVTDVLLEAPITPPHRVFADPDDVADVADGLVHHWHTPHGEYGAEWDRAPEIRTACETFRHYRVLTGRTYSLSTQGRRAALVSRAPSPARSTGAGASDVAGGRFARGRSGRAPARTKAC